MVKLMEMGGRPTTLLDGDIVRKNLSSELGFSKEHRDLNIRRIGYVASEITKNGGIAICAPIAPYAATRRAVREDIEQFGAFIEVHVATSIEECERRDRKGLYKLAREGKIKGFTGISDPYDVPENPELSLETENVDVDNCAHQILLKLESMGLITGKTDTRPRPIWPRAFYHDGLKPILRRLVQRHRLQIVFQRQMHRKCIRRRQRQLFAIRIMHRKKMVQITRLIAQFRRQVRHINRLHVNRLGKVKFHIHRLPLSDIDCLYNALRYASVQINVQQPVFHHRLARIDAIGQHE
jgi:adenylyl-sulfate kinase